MLLKQIALLVAVLGFVSGFRIATTQSPLLFLSNGKSKYELGQLRFEDKWELVASDVVFPSGKYCVGISGHDCLNYKEVEYPLSQKVLLSLVDSSINSVTLLQSTEEGLVLEQQEIAKGASPRLATKNVAMEGGKSASQSSQSDQDPLLEKSFIQKYWMYIVPVLLMIMLMGGDGKKN